VRGLLVEVFLTIVRFQSGSYGDSAAAGVAAKLAAPNTAKVQNKEEMRSKRMNCNPDVMMACLFPVNVTKICCIAAFAITHQVNCEQSLRALVPNGELGGWFHGAG
jgi:hypothetical protein